MANAQTKSPHRKKRRERKHVLSVNVVTPRIIFYSMMKKSRSLLTYTLVTLTLILLTWGVFKGAKHIFIEGERFLLTEIHISPEPNSNSFINYSSLPSLTGLDCGISIFSYDLGDIKSSLEKRAEIKKVTLTRRLPGTVLIDVDERTPVAKVFIDGKNMIIDKDGYCFQSELATDVLLNRLPVIIPLYGHDVPLKADTQQLTDIGLQRAVHLVSTWNSFDVGIQLLSVEVKNYHSLEVTTQANSRILFGYYEHERQISDFCSLNSHSESTGQQIVSANLLPYKNIPVIFDKKRAPSKRSSRQAVFPPTGTNSIQDASEDDVLLILEQG